MKIIEWINFYKNPIFPVGEGWRPLVTKLCQDIINIEPTVEVSQVKEKYGGLRFYINCGTDEIYNLIDKAETESLTICEECGTKENVTTSGGWLLTLCLKCRQERNKESKKLKIYHDLTCNCYDCREGKSLRAKD